MTNSPMTKIPQTGSTSLDEPVVTNGLSQKDSAGIQDSNWPRLRRHLPFAVITIEFLLIALLVRQFQLESQTFCRLVYFSLAGFLIHHALPSKARLPFFAALSTMATIAIVNGDSPLQLTGPGVMLVALGMVLIGICHLPIAFWARVSLLSIVCISLAVMRANSELAPALNAVWPILASMFMFRMVLYLYELKNKTAPFDLSHALAYFFMIPNACFPLFPVVDYRTFCRNQYNDDALYIYQVGIKWMFRGAIQLLLYRLVYHFILLDILEVRNAGDVARYMVATYLLYLRVSGQFHFIVGMLHMFGFNLPETHHLYLLASSFTDFWRRINIYWKDFIMKVFFYPVSLSLMRLGTVRMIAISTVIAFFATWALHSWQWFWFRGTFLVTWQDIAFWTILAVLVLFNAIYESLHGRQRALSQATLSGRTRIIVGLKTVGTFLVICSLWTLWSSKSLGELQILAENMLRHSWSGTLQILCGLAAIGIAGAIWGVTTERSLMSVGTLIAEQRERFFRRSSLTISTSVALLLLFSFSTHRRDSGFHDLVNGLRQDNLNATDLEQQRRGYYEELDDARAHQILWARTNSPPPNWTNKFRIIRGRDGFIHCELVPSTVAKISGTPATTNRWGMRDRDYTQEKPTNAIRLVLLGSSHEIGSGVGDDETFENIVEDRWNREVGMKHSENLELLNLSAPGLSIVEKLYLLEEKGFDFRPDAVLFSVNAVDRQFLLNHLPRVLTEGRPIPYQYLTELFQRVGVDANSERIVIQHQLEPHVVEIYEWIFQRLQEICKAQNVRVYVVYRPSPNMAERRVPLRREELLTGAANTDLDVFDLTAAFDHIEEKKTLVLAKWDDHTNALGHRLLADALYNQLTPRIQEMLTERNSASR